MRDHQVRLAPGMGEVCGDGRSTVGRSMVGGMPVCEMHGCDSRRGRQCDRALSLWLSVRTSLALWHCVQSAGLVPHSSELKAKLSPFA